MVIIARTGTASDPRGLEGALQLAMRSLRRGAGRRSSVQIDETVDGLGAELSASADVCTASIHATVIRRNLEPLLDLVADVLLRPTFAPKEVSQVRRETRADIIDSRDDDRTLAGRWFRRTLFAGHPFGRPSVGTLASLGRVGREDTREAFAQTFVKSNLMFAAAGDIRPAEFERVVASRFAAVPVGAAPDASLPEPPRLKGRRLVIVDKPERTQTQIYIGGMGSHPFDEDHVALHVGNTIFGGTFTARLMREVRSKRGWSYGASSRMGRDRAREAWSMWTFPAATDAAACVALQLELFDQLLHDGVTERELAFAKNFLVRGWAFEIDTAPKRLNQRIDEAVVPLPRGFYDSYLDRVRSVTRDDVNAALRRRLSSRDLLVSIVATAKDMRASLEKAIPGLAETRVIPFDTDELS